MAIVSNVMIVRNLLLYKLNPSKYIKAILKKGNDIVLDDYDEVYVCSKDKATFFFLEYLGQQKKLITTINVIEEGVNSYCNEDSVTPFKKYCDAINLWVYEPRYVIYSKKIPWLQVCSIPKLSKTDEMLHHCLNNIFAYKESFSVNDSNRVIFFEQVAEPMPEYYKNLNIIMKYVLHNSIKKHVKEHKLYAEKCRIVRAVLDSMEKFGIRKDIFLVKLHPRTRKGIPDGCKEYIWEDDNFKNIPWEVYLLNKSFCGNLWITTASGAVTNALYCFEENFNIKICLTYKLNEEYKMYYPDVIDEFYTRIAEDERYGKRLFVVNSLDNLRQLVKEISAK